MRILQLTFVNDKNSQENIINNSEKREDFEKPVFFTNLINK